jgi:tetratricopeptide (TPR) repeat protein
LPAQLAGHARLASVLGARFTVPEVDALIRILEKEEGLDDVQLDASVGIQRLVDAGLMIRHRTGIVEFRHALLRDTIYQLLPDDRRKRFHRAAFQMYATSAHLPQEQRLPRLALHAARSGAKEEAARAYLELADRSAHTHAYLEAELAYTGALENLAGADDPRVAQAARGRGLMRFRVGRSDDALKDLRDARTRAKARGAVEDEVEILLDEATVLDWTDDFPSSEELVREAERLTGAPTGLTAARLTMARARVHHRRLESEACVDLGVRAVQMADALGGAGYETMIIALLMVAVDCSNLGRLDEAEAFFERVLAAAQARGDMQHVCAGTSNRVFLWFARKDVDRLFADVAEVIRIAREIGSAFLEFNAIRNMAEVEYVIEALDKAGEHAQRALEVATQLWGSDSAALSVCELLLARVALCRGDRGEAARLVERIRARLASGIPGVELAASDQVMLSVVDLASRGATREEWGELLERASTTGLQPLEEVEVLEAAAMEAARAGRGEEARGLFERALGVCAIKPNLMSNRVERRFRALAAESPAAAVV